MHDATANRSLTNRGIWTVCMVGLVALHPRIAFGETGVTWRTLQPGVELATIDFEPRAPSSDNKLIAVRIDPHLSPLTLALATEKDKRPRPAADWCRVAGLAVAINAGMFQDDGLSNVGHLVDGDHVNSSRWASKYHSVLAFGPRDPKLPSAIMVDLDEDGSREKLRAYKTVIQNLRLIKAADGHGRNVWQEQNRRWSEAAIALDDHSRVLFLFSRSAVSMAEFNRRILDLPLGIERAMHVEGGPEASLSIHVGGIDTDYFGSFETGFMENDGNHRPWPIPNVLGVAKAP